MSTRATGGMSRGPRPIDALGAGVVGFGIAGLLIGRLTLALNPQVHSSLWDTLVLLFDLALLYALLGLLPALLGAVVVALSRVVPSPWQRWLKIVVVAGLLLAPIAYCLLLPDLGLAGDFVANTVFGASNATRLGVLVAALTVMTAASLIAAGLLGRWAKQSGTTVRRLVTALCAVLALGIVVTALFGRPDHAAAGDVAGPELGTIGVDPDNTPTPVVLLVVDGADPRAIESLVSAGELPTFARLQAEATWGELETLAPARSHTIWTSIATGRTPEAHGIRNFTTTRLPGMSATIAELPLHSGVNKVLPRILAVIPGMPSIHAPYTSNMRQAAALWNIVGRFYPVGAYRWLVTWPAEPVDGFYVAGGMRWAQFFFGFRNEVDAGLAEGSAYPDSAFEGLSLPERRKPDAAETAPYIGDATTELNADDPRLRMIEDAVTDPTGEVVAQLIEKYEPMFTAISFYSVDSHEHLFAKYHRKGGEFSNAVDEAYRFADRRLDELLERLGPDTNVLVISDHGYDFVNNHHIFGPPGVFYALGPAFEAGRRVEGLTIYDVAPLVLRLLDLPVADDMEATEEGRYEGALATEFAATRPARPRIATWGSGQPERAEAIESPIDEEMTDVLRSLGYID